MNFQTLNLLFNCNKEFNHQKIRTHGLTDTECMICSFIYSSPECSQDDVVQALRLDKTTVGKALQKLESKGFVIREQSLSDRRKKVLQITESGFAQIKNVMHLHDEWMNSVMSCLTLEEQAQFEDYCRRLLVEAESLATKKHDGETEKCKAKQRKKPR